MIAIATQDKIFAKTVSNVREVRARGAFVILLAKESARVEEDIADIQIRIPDLADQFTVFPIAAVLQLIAYYAFRGKDPGCGPAAESGEIRDRGVRTFIAHQKTGRAVDSARPSVRFYSLLLLFLLVPSLLYFREA